MEDFLSVENFKNFVHKNKDELNPKVYLQLPFLASDIHSPNREFPSSEFIYKTNGKKLMRHALAKGGLIHLSYHVIIDP